MERAWTWILSDGVQLSRDSVDPVRTERNTAELKHAWPRGERDLQQYTSSAAAPRTPVTTATCPNRRPSSIASHLDKPSTSTLASACQSDRAGMPLPSSHV